MSVSDSSPNPDAQRDVEATSPQTARHVAEPTANLKERPAHVSWMDVEGGAGPASAGIGDDAPPPPPAMSSVHIAVQREDDERAGPPPEALSRCRTDADREQLQRYYKHRASIVSLGHIGMPPSLSTGKQPLSEAEGQRAYNELVKSLLLRTMPLIVCGLLLVVAGGLFCAYGEIIQLGVEGNAPIAKVSWLLGAPPVQQFGFGILGVANENQPLYYRLVILAGCVRTLSADSI